MKKITATTATKVAKVAKSSKKVTTEAKIKATATLATEPKKRGRPVSAKVEVVKRGRKVSVKSAVNAIIAPVAKKRGRPASVVPTDQGRIGEVMPDSVRNALLAALENQRVPASHKTIINDAVKASYSADHYRFTALHDVVRQTVRNAALKVLRSNGGQLNHTARLFGIASANLKKWRDEETQGIHNIRARGRPEGKKNDYRTIIHKGKEIKVRIDDTEAIRRMSNGIPRTEYRLKKGVQVA